MIFRDEICNSRNVSMCPTCEKCPVKYLSDACIESEFAGLFDNSATLFFAIFMSLWGKNNLRMIISIIIIFIIINFIAAISICTFMNSNLKVEFSNCCIEILSNRI